MDPCHPDDTLFLICEGDWRIYRADTEVYADQVEKELSAERLSRVAAQVRAQLRGESVPVAARPLNDEEAALADEMASRATADAFEAAVLQQSALDARQRLALTTEGLEVFTPQRRWDAQQGRPAPAPTPELLDIVGMCNKAARVHRGGLVWLGWNPTPDRKWKANKPKRIANGSNCIAVTAAGARWLQPRLEAMDKQYVCDAVCGPARMPAPSGAVDHARRAPRAHVCISPSFSCMILCLYTAPERLAFRLGAEEAAAG